MSSSSPPTNPSRPARQAWRLPHHQECARDPEDDVGSDPTRAEPTIEVESETPCATTIADRLRNGGANSHYRHSLARSAQSELSQHALNRHHWLGVVEAVQQPQLRGGTRDREHRHDVEHDGRHGQGAPIASDRRGTRRGATVVLRNKSFRPLATVNSMMSRR